MFQKKELIMDKRKEIETILSSDKIVVAGVSRNEHKMGSAIFKELSKNKRSVFPLNPNTDIIMNKTCYPDIQNLPEKVDALVLVVKPEETVKLVKQAHSAGISRIWMQQGSESPEAIEFCESNNMTVVSKECIFMYLDPVSSIHKFHRGLWKIFGKYHSS